MPHDNEKRQNMFRLRIYPGFDWKPFYVFMQNRYNYEHDITSI